MIEETIDSGHVTKCCASTIHDIHAQMVLNPTSVGNSFFSLAQISVSDVNRVKKYNHHICMPKINPGTMIQALAAHEANSTVL
jgi:hypothetical protein